MANPQTLVAFTEFVDFIKDNDKWVAETKSVKEEVARLTELLGAQATVEAAKKYKEESEKKLAKAYLDLDDKEVAFSQVKDSKEAEFKQREGVVTQRENDSNFREQAVAKSEVSLKERTIALQEEAVRQETRSAMLDKREQELNDLSLELKSKAEAIKSLVG